MPLDTLDTGQVENETEEMRATYETAIIYISIEREFYIYATWT